MNLTRLALGAAIGLFSMAVSAQSMTVAVPGAPVAAGSTGNATITFAGNNIAGAQFRLCYNAAVLTPGTVGVPAGLSGLTCVAPSAGNCPAGTTQGFNCAGFVASGTWTFPQTITVPFTVAAGASGTSTPLAFGTTPAPLFADGNGNDVTPTIPAVPAFPIAGVVITPPNLTYNPTTAAGVTFPSGVAGAANATITATPSGGSGTGADATTTLNNCTASAGFTITNAPINFSFVGNTTTASTIQLSCTRGGAAQTGTLSCSEQRAANAAVTRTWNLTCPQAVVISGPTLGYAPAAGGTVAFGNVTIPANSVQNIVVTPSGGAGGGTTTLGTCSITGANASEFALVSTATLTFTAGTATPQNLGVRFTPALPVGAKTASLSCSEAVQNGATTTRTWTLSGSSVQAPPQFSANPAPPGPVAFGSVVVGQAASRTIVVSNPAPAGAANLPLTGCTLANATGVTLSPTSLNVAPQGSGTLTLTYTPGSVSTLTNATLTCTDPLVLEATRTWNLTGQGVQPTAVPTLGGFGLWAMLGLMLGTGLVVVATRKQ